MASYHTVSVLLVEDNDIDREAVRRGFAKHKIANPIIDAADGIEALELLRGSGGKAALARPHILLVDINMPRMNGIELVTELRADPTLRDTIVFMLTTSKSDEDRIASFQLNVAGYIVKNEAGIGFARLVELLDHYWRLVELPS